MFLFFSFLFGGSPQVWNNSSVPLQSVVDDDETKSIAFGGPGEDNLLESLQSSVTGISMKASLKSDEDMDGAPLSTLWSDDPEPIKRLKRELGVALAEENYGHAAAIRDHPYMKLHCEVEIKGGTGEEEIRKAEILGPVMKFLCLSSKLCDADCR